MHRSSLKSPPPTRRRRRRRRCFGADQRVRPAPSARHGFLPHQTLKPRARPSSTPTRSMTEATMPPHKVTRRFLLSPASVTRSGLETILRTISRLNCPKMCFRCPKISCTLHTWIHIIGAAVSYITLIIFDPHSSVI
jgi:hypothetical protein